MKLILKFAAIAFFIANIGLNAQGRSWRLWADGLPMGVFPKLAVAPNHDIFYGLVGVNGAKGVLFKANTENEYGSFTSMPQAPFPPSTGNNIQCIETNLNSEPVIGIFRSNLSEPFIFKFNNITQTWSESKVESPPNLGAYAMARSPNGTLWVGAKWGYVYKSTDGGETFSKIDENISIKSNFPCYYPAWGGNESDGAIYSINVDSQGRVYAGTECAGVVFSDDDGLTWQPADLYACLTDDNNKKDSASKMRPLSQGGNIGGIGFTASNQVIWCGVSMWTFNWENAIGYADMVTHETKSLKGIPPYLVTAGLQVSKFVTSVNGEIFLHSGGNKTDGTVGIYSSLDGINWEQINTGINGANDAQSQGSLAIDGNKVFMATHDGKVWILETKTSINNSIKKFSTGNYFEITPNPSTDFIFVRSEYLIDKMEIFTILGESIMVEQSHSSVPEQDFKIDVSSLEAGIYLIKLGGQVNKFIKI